MVSGTFCGGAAGRPVRTSQRVHRPNPPPAAISDPSGLKASAYGWASIGSGGPSGRPVCASQSRIVPSTPDVAIVRPSGLNRTCWR